MSDRSGFLRARRPADQARLERLVAAVLPTSSTPAASGSMTLRKQGIGRQADLVRLVLSIAALA